LESTLAQRLESIHQRIDAAAKNVDRSSSEIELVIVTKNHGFELALELLKLGENQFGENKDQEASAKAQAVLDNLDPGLVGPTWHFVGQLQSNKVKSMLGYSSVLHSLDRPSLLKELSKQLGNSPDKKLDVFIELNLTGDSNRGGLDPENLIEFAEQVLAVPQINLLGVMGVAGLDIDPKVDFERIQAASQRLGTVSSSATFISAGMSGDFEEAISFGATHLRIGTAITGKR
jgi:pyridoxal phosphate enzyme (YggS family)